jgi:hypothetical protein
MLISSINNKSRGADCKKLVKEILVWGGVDRYNNVAKDLLELTPKQLREYLVEVKKYFSDTLDTEVPFGYDGRKLEMDSGTTKVYSLVCENFIIYDSRVGAALGLLVRRWSEEKNVEKIPEVLKFAWGDNGTERKPEKRRNPNKPGAANDIFPSIHNRGDDRTHHNIYANWLLQLVLESDKDSDFAKLKENERLRALEAALFMIGYCVNERYSECLRDIEKVSIPGAPFIDEEYAIEQIKLLFGDGTQSISIPDERSGNFEARKTKDGIMVEKLGSEPFLPWAVFTNTIRLLNEKGGRARKGSAQNSARLGDPDLPFDSIEGFIAQSVYGKTRGISVLRRITHISGIMRAAKICKSERGYLVYEV